MENVPTMGEEQIDQFDKIAEETQKGTTDCPQVKATVSVKAWNPRMSLSFKVVHSWLPVEI